MRLLLLEPDGHFADRLQRSLESEGYVIDFIGTVADARRGTPSSDDEAIAPGSIEPARSSTTVDEATVIDIRSTPDGSRPLDLEIWFG